MKKSGLLLKEQSLPTIFGLLWSNMSIPVMIIGDRTEKFTPNVTIRLASGGYIGGGLYHSQNIEGSLASIPGVRIVYPSFADDAAGLLRTAIRSRGMTMFMEPKALYNDPKAATVIPDDFEVPFGKARIRRNGDDLVMITYGNTTHMCLEAA